MPPPIHMVAIARVPPILLSMDDALPVILAPEAPSGCHIEIAPPSMFTQLVSIPNSEITARL